MPFSAQPHSQMNRPQQPAESRWLALVASLPTEDPAARMRMLRTLESLGAAVMREGVFLLPDTPACRQGIERLAEYIASSTGAAHVLNVTCPGEAQQRMFRSLFDRSARYRELIKVVESLKIGYGISDPAALSRVLHKQRRELEAISALDFFPTEVQERARGALAQAEAQVHRLLFPARAGAGAQPGEPLRRRVWATRRPLWADRLACAWLIRRFIDPEGSVIWLDKSQPLPPDAIGYAFEGARFANSTTRITFEAMLERLGPAGDGALARIGAIVRFLEVPEGRAVPEAAGVQTLLQGAARRAGTDDELLAEAEKTFDLLYEAYLEAPRR